MQAKRHPVVAIIGSGLGGLSAAIYLAASGRRVLLLERESIPGGKIRTLQPGTMQVDTGPCVLALRPVFEQLFATAGTRLDAHLALRDLPVLGRHVWPDGRYLDLMADPLAASDAIGDFAGAEAARGFEAMRARAARCYLALESHFLTVQRPGMLALGALGTKMGVSPFGTLWNTLGEHFADPRLRQVFGRMAAYVGTSPLQAPATLLLVAHVELSGLCAVEGGMARLAQALAALATAQGVEIRYGAEVSAILVQGGRVAGLRLADGETLEAQQVVLNADPASLAAGHFGAAAAGAVSALPASRRSFSAISWAVAGRAEGLALPRQTVFHPADPTAEYVALVRGQMPASPTVTLWAQGRTAPEAAPEGTEPLSVLVPAPARADQRGLDADAIWDGSQAAMARAGVRLNGTPMEANTPADHERRAPGTGGALYGQAVQGWRSIFSRPSGRTGLPGLVLAGGGTHPGAGMAMAVLSGRLAAETVIGQRE